MQGDSRVFHRDLSQSLPLATIGDGMVLVDDRGRRYLDACGGAAVSCLGHSHPKPIAAIKQQLDRVAFAHTSFFTNEPSERLATTLIDRAPPGFGAGRAMFLGSGSEAMEAALKLARQYHLEIGQPARSIFIARDMAYHGNTLGALAVGGHVARRRPYAPLLVETGRVPACYAYRNKDDHETEEAFGRRMADALETEILRLGPEHVAGFVVEPVSGATLGCVPPAAGYVKRIREICDQYGVLLIADEVMCGSGRTGTFYALEQEGVAPDLVTIAKGLGAGFQPIAAMLASGRVVAAIAQGSGLLANGHTYMSHAVACAGALAVLDTIDEEDLLGNVRARGAELADLLHHRFGQHPHVGDIRGRGLFYGIEFVQDRATKGPFPADRRLAATLKAAALDVGLMIYPASGCADGVLGDHVLLAPPYIVRSEQLEEIVDRLGTALDRTLASLPLAA